MANETTKTSELPAATSLVATDYFVVVANTTGTAKTKRVRADLAFANSALPVRAANLTISGPATVANSTINCTAGQIFWDSSYLYVAVANNQLKRVALSSF